MIDRITTASPTFKIDDENLALLDRICHRVNSHPLAIELVAAILRGREPLIDEECSCRKCLELAVWTDPKSIHFIKKKKLAVLFT